MSESPTRNAEGTTSQLLSDEALDQVNGGVQSPRELASGQVSGFTIDITGGRIDGAMAPKPPATLCNNEVIPVIIKF